MRRARVDANQPEIVRTFKTMGASVQHLHQVGEGCTDIVIGLHGINVMVEIKDGSKCPSDRKLTPPQVLWHHQWRGWKAIVETVDDCVALVAKVARIRAQIKEWPEDK